MSDAERQDLHLAEGMNYECVRCGRSCGEFWEIKVTPEEAESIRARSADELRAAGAADPRSAVIASPWTPGGFMMRCGEPGPCCLQDAEGLCTLHTLYGFMSKPNICRSFPYKFVETPRGIYCGLTFACTAVLNNMGPPLASQRAQIEELFGWTNSRRTVATPPELATAIPLSWDQYETIERDLMDLVEDTGEPIGDRLLMQYLYLHLLIKLVREARESSARETADAAANDEPLAVYRQRVREDRYALLRSLKRRRPNSTLLRRTFLGFAHALRNTYGRRMGRLRGYTAMMGAYVAHALGRGSIDMPALSRPVSAARIKSIAFDPARPEFDALLTRFFRHRLERKDLLVAESIQAGLQFQLLHWGLIHWYAAALAADRGASEVGWEHLTDAVRLVEKYYVLHSTFDHLFAKMPLLRLFMDRLLEHPLYAFTLARPE